MICNNEYLVQSITLYLKEDIKSSLDMSLNLEYISIYKQILEICEDIEPIEKLKIVDTLCHKVQSANANKY